MARELGLRGIRVNVVYPGLTDTDMNPASGALAEVQRSTMAIPRYGKPDDVADLVAWLAGPHGASVTGAEFTIDGAPTPKRFDASVAKRLSPMDETLDRIIRELN